MPNAIIQSQRRTHIADFGLDVTFDAVLTALAKTNVDITAVDGNGTTDVDFSIEGTTPTERFRLLFTLPENKEGSFSVTITGSVQTQASSQLESVTSNTIKISYDTIPIIRATFGDVLYQQDGSITLPITFDTEVIAESKTAFGIFYVSGDRIPNPSFRLVGKDTEHKLVFDATTLKGSVQVVPNGDVIRQSNRLRKPVEATPKLIAFGYQ